MTEEQSPLPQPANSAVVSLHDPLTLPCGAILSNRIAKASLTEGLATFEGVPTPELNRLYALWSAGGAGLLLSGNILVDANHLERPGNVILDVTTMTQESLLLPSSSLSAKTKEHLKAFRSWTKAGTHTGRNHFWAQLNHGGRQVPMTVNSHPKAPSAVKVALPGFGTPVAMTLDDIASVQRQFVYAAQVCIATGFTGIQLHAAHGYLFSAFLSPISNVRTDDYGGSLHNRARLLVDVAREVRAAVGPTVPVAVKLNSADFQKGGFDFYDSRQVVQWLEEASVDLIEISGGTYEQPAIMGLEVQDPSGGLASITKESTLAREAYYVEFAKAMQAHVTVPLMVTGGFRTTVAVQHALETGAANVIGLGRPMCTLTNAPNVLLEASSKDDTTEVVLPRLENTLSLFPSWMKFLQRIPFFKKLNSFSPIFWYYEQLHKLGQDGVTHTTQDLSVFASLVAVETRASALMKQRKMAAAGAGADDGTVQRRLSGVISKSSTFVAIGVVGLAFWYTNRK